MKKQILVAATIAAMAVSANAGSMMDSASGSSKGSSTIAEGIFGMSGTTVDMISGGIASSANSAGNMSTKAVDTAIFVINNPSTASEMSVNASGQAITWVITKSGQAIQIAANGVVYFFNDPSGATSHSIQSTSNAIKESIDMTGKHISALNAYLSEKYGDDARLVRTGAGEIYTAGAGSVVVSTDMSSKAGRSVIKFIDDHSVDSMQVSSQEARDLVVAAFAASGKAFDALFKSGKQYDGNN